MHVTKRTHLSWEMTNSMMKMEKEKKSKRKFKKDGDQKENKIKVLKGQTTDIIFSPSISN